MVILSDPGRCVMPRNFTFKSPSAIGGWLTTLHRAYGKKLDYGLINYIDISNISMRPLDPAGLLNLRKFGLTPALVKVCRKPRPDCVTVLIRNRSSFYIVVYDPDTSYATHCAWTALQGIAHTSKAWDVLDAWFPKDYADAADFVDVSFTTVEDATKYCFVLDCPPTKPDLHAYIQEG